MELQITGINIEIQPKVRSYIQRKLGKLTRHLPNIMETKVEISEEKTKSKLQHYLVRATSGSGGAVFHGEERGEDLFIAIDKVADIMTRQLEHHKGKMYEKGRGSSLARGLYKTGKPSRTAETESEKKLVKIKHFAVKPITAAAAITEMEAMEHDFFLFTDAETKKLKLLYRRKDGNYGLIEPEY